MTRGLGVSRWLADALEPLDPLLAVLTQTGDTWLLGLLVALLYVLAGAAPLPGWDRRRGAAVLGAGLLAIAATGLLKVVFGLARPPGAGEPAYVFAGMLGDLYTGMATADGFGFPSGHATGATAIYGTIAGLVAAAHRRRAVLIAGLLAGTAAVTRIGLGVHYLVDVLAGAAVGLLLAAVAIRWVRRPGVAIGAAVPVAAAWAVVTDGGAQAVGVTGLAAGALIVWTLAEDRLVALPAPTGRSAWAVALVGTVVAAGTVVAIEAGTVVTAGFLGLVGMGGLVAVPLVQPALGGPSQS